MGSIFVKINVEVNSDGLTALIEGQLGKLSLANQQLAKLVTGTTGGLNGTVNLLNGISIPDLDLSTDLSQSFSSLTNLIPSDPTAFIKPLSKAVKRLFAGLNINLVAQVTKYIEAFQALHELTQIKFTLEVAAEDEQSGGSLGAMKANGNDAGVEAAFDSVSDFLTLLPDPLNVVTILQFIRNITQVSPRRFFSLRYFPILDELNDKLDTALSWHDMDAATLNAQLAANLNSLGLSIQDLLITKGAQPIADEISAISSHIKADTIKDSLAGIINGLNSLAEKVRSGQLTGTDGEISTVSTQLGQLQTALAEIKEHLLNGEIDALNGRLIRYQDRMTERVL
ncbi:MAG: hypothetical protein AB1489_38380, partial [Acidobacteriota bacterium]